MKRKSSDSHGRGPGRPRSSSNSKKTSAKVLKRDSEEGTKSPKVNGGF